MGIVVSIASREFLMSVANGVEWFREMLWTAVLVAGPVVLTVVVVGLIMAVLQAATQVNDQAIAFGPKAIAMVAALVASSPWMLTQLSEFMLAVFSAIEKIH